MRNDITVKSVKSIQIGTTLIEMIMVVAIITAITAGGVALFQRAHDNGMKRQRVSAGSTSDDHQIFETSVLPQRRISPVSPNISNQEVF